MVKKISFVAVLLLVASFLLINSSCKSCNKKEETPVSTIDTTAVSMRPVTGPTLPHADSALIPILAKILDEAFDASKKKDYNKLGDLIVYRGPDSTRYGYAVYNAKNAFDRKILSITAEVFNKWTRNVESLDYARVFAMGQPDGRTLPVLEVIFISKQSMDRKFFGFLEIDGEFKIADVTSSLQ